MRVVRHADGRSFLDTARSWLVQAEAENNLILGIASSITHPTPTEADPPYLATVHDGGGIIGCALRTPPHKLVITRMGDGAIEALVDDAAGLYEALPGVLGPEPIVAAFAEAWSTRTGQRATRGRRQRIYEIDRVIRLSYPTTGRLRLAGEMDLDLVAGWIASFFAEALTETLDAVEVARTRISRGMIFLWDDPEPVSMAAWMGQTPNGVRVALVYTPPGRRGRGYASACVAELTSLLLERGNRFCWLYTDPSNPTSNRIHQRLGYRAVCDATDYDFAT
jgi:predicted GNAT family acetyltransferase